MKQNTLLSAVALTFLIFSGTNAQNWSLLPSFPGGPKTSMAGLEDSVLFVGTGEGVWRSPDYGFTWKQMLKEQVIYTLHTAYNGTVLAGAVGKLFYSEDKGNTWTEIDVPTDFPVKSFASTSTGKYFFITGEFTNEEGYKGDGVFFNEGDLTTWTARNTGINNIALYAEHITVDDYNRVYVGFADEYTTGNGGLFMSDNDGQQWQKISLNIDGLGAIKTANVFSINATPDDTLIYSVNGIITNFLVTLNLKKHRDDLQNTSPWKHMHVGSSNNWVLSKLINPIHFAANGDWYSSISGTQTASGFIISKDKGKTWTLSNTGLGASLTQMYEPFTFYETAHGVVMAAQFLDERLYFTNRSMLNPVEIKGKVVDDRGKPLAATIKNTWQQVYANMEGEFTLTVPKGWSGTIRPIHGQHSYEPAERSYTNVQESVTQQNFVGTYTGTHSVWGIVSDVKGNPLSDVKVEGFAETLYTNQYGAFVAQVPHGWSGEIFVSKDGKEIQPGTVSIPNVYENIYYLEFTARAAGTVLLGGQVSYWENIPVDDIALEGFSEEVQVMEDGTFVAELLPGWSGTITPERAGYTFTPASVSVTNLQEDQLTLHFEMEPTSTYTIEGQVLHRSNGLSGVAIQGFPQAVETNAQGEFLLEVPAGWSGTLTAALESYEFSPATINVEPVQENKSGLLFEATYTGTYRISGTIRDSNNQPMYSVLIEGVEELVMTDMNGRFSIDVPADWEGTLTPVLTQYQFSPAERSYTALENDLSEQNFQAEVITSVDNPFNTDFSTFPNPTADGYFTIRLDEAPTQIVLRSASGQTIKHLPAVTEQQCYIAESGLYLLQVFVKGEMISKKLMVR